MPPTNLPDAITVPNHFIAGTILSKCLNGPNLDKVAASIPPIQSNLSFKNPHIPLDLVFVGVIISLIVVFLLLSLSSQLLSTSPSSSLSPNFFSFGLRYVSIFLSTVGKFVFVLLVLLLLVKLKELTESIIVSNIVLKLVYILVVLSFSISSILYLPSFISFAIFIASLYKLCSFTLSLLLLYKSSAFDLVSLKVSLF